MKMWRSSCGRYSDIRTTAKEALRHGTKKLLSRWKSRRWKNQRHRAKVSSIQSNRRKPTLFLLLQWSQSLNQRGIQGASAYEVLAGEIAARLDLKTAG
jgi:hypothetical protein